MAEIPSVRESVPVEADRPWAAEALRALARAGYRTGEAREAVIEVLDSAGGGLTAQDVADRLRGTPRQVGAASVYRALGVLAKLGLVHGLDVGRGLMRYELVRSDGDHQHHLVCERCGRTELFHDPELESVIGRLEASAPYRVIAHDVVFRGVCPACDHPN